MKKHKFTVGDYVTWICEPYDGKGPFEAKGTIVSIFVNRSGNKIYRVAPLTERYHIAFPRRKTTCIAPHNLSPAYQIKD